MNRNRRTIIYMLLITAALVPDLILSGLQMSHILIPVFTLIFLLNEKKKKRNEPVCSDRDYPAGHRAVGKFLSSLPGQAVDETLAVLVRTGFSADRYTAPKIREELTLRIYEIIRKCDFIGRGDPGEYFLIFSSIDSDQMVETIARRIAGRLTEGITIDGVSYHVTINLGLLRPAGEDSPGEIMDKCVAALDEAVNLGANTFAISGDDDNSGRNRSSLIDIYLREALKNNEMDVFLQPKFSTATGKMDSAEALLRWNHPVLGQVSPDEFIPLAESSGYIGELSRFVYHRAFQILRDLDEMGYGHLRLSLNISALEIRENSLLGNLTDALLFAEVDPSRIDLEITESMLLHNIDQVKLTLEEVKSMGFNISIDDFGKGYSSLGYLRSYRFDTLKIDKSFIEQIQSDGNARAIVEAIITLSRALKLETVAEGVELAEQYEILRDMGCDHIQGYYFCRPVNYGDFLTYMKSSDKILI